MMEAIVLAGGFGTRLRPVVGDVPKPMAPVAGRPFLEHLLASLARKGLRRVVLSVGYMAEFVMRHFGERFEGLEIAYAVETQPLGTGGAARFAMDHCIGNAFLLLNGDTFLDIELAELCAQHGVHQRPIVVGREVPDVSRFGSLAVELGRLTGFREKGAVGAGLINAGCYVLDRSLFRDWAVGTPFSLERDLLPAVLEHQRIDVFVTQGLFIDIGIPSEYKRASEVLARA